MKRVAKAMLSYSEEERRATMVGVNLFFGALLGANLGVTEKLDLWQYATLIMALATMVMAMFTIAVSRRPVVIWSTVVSVAVIVSSVLLRVDQYWPAEVTADVYRTLVTLLIWLAFITGVKVTPTAPETAPAPAPVAKRDLITEEN